MTNKNQSGRSMVEMLGTLAVMGVLSIGGIMGYSYAVDKYHANQIMNDVNLRGIDLVAQASRGGDFSLDEWPTKTSADYDIGLEIDEATNTTEGGIYINGVEKDICEIIADDLLPEKVELVIDGEAYTSGKCGETNKMVFYYDAVAEALGEKDEGCNGVLIDGVCMDCPENATVSADKTNCICSSGSIWNTETNECTPPPSECIQSLASCDPDPSKIKMSGNTIIYDGDLDCGGTGGDFSDCILKVNGTLDLGDLSSNSNFECKSITAESSTGHGIVGTNLTLSNNDLASTCKLVGKTSADGHYGIFLENLNITGNVEIEGHATNIQTSGSGVYLRGGTFSGFLGLDGTAYSLDLAPIITGTLNNSKTGYGVFSEGIYFSNSVLNGEANFSGTGGGAARLKDTNIVTDLTNTNPPHKLPSGKVTLTTNGETTWSCNGYCDGYFEDEIK